MGDLLVKKHKAAKKIKKKIQLEKARRMGWPLLSEYIPISFKEGMTQCETLKVYPKGVFCEEKLIP